MVVVEADIRQEIPYDSERGRTNDEENLAGELSLSTRSVSYLSRPTLRDYQFGGCKINVSFAIDFSLKNGKDTNPDSPHRLKNYRNGDGYNYSEFNDYQKAILDLGSILGELDTSNMNFSVYGFGVREHNVDLQLFQCGRKREVHGIHGVLKAYGDVRHGDFSPCKTASFVENINMGSRKARHNEKNSDARLNYSVLLILTAGEIDNIKETKEALSNAGSSPLSVIFVGIGNKNFKTIKEIVKDHGPEDRPIASFVDFHVLEDKEEHRSQLLKHMPNQLVDYFWDKGISPHYM